MNLENVNKMLKKSSRIAKTRNDLMRIYGMATRITSYVLTGLETGQEIDNLIDDCDFCKNYAREIADELNEIATEILAVCEDETIY